MAEKEPEPENNAEFVAWMCKQDMISEDIVKETFLKVDRAYYAPKKPYSNEPSALGFWSVTSAPGIQSSSIKNLLPALIPTEENPNRRILDIGCGSAYTTHLMAELVGENGIVVGIENVEQLRAMGENNLKKTERGRHLLDTGRIKLLLGDGRMGLTNELREEIPGIDEDTKWDAIHVAATSKKLPEELLRQLKAPGIMYVPLAIEEELPEKEYFVDRVWKIEKDAKGEITKTVIFSKAIYVKLADPPKDSEEEMNKPGYGMFNK